MTFIIYGAGPGGLTRSVRALAWGRTAGTSFGDEDEWTRFRQAPAEGEE
jgi:hypothetical protein